MVGCRLRIDIGIVFDDVQQLFHLRAIKTPAEARSPSAPQSFAHAGNLNRMTSLLRFVVTLTGFASFVDRQRRSASSPVSLALLLSVC